MKAKRSILTSLAILFLFSCQAPDSKQPSRKSEAPTIIIKDYGHALFSLDPDRLHEGLDSLSESFRIFTGATRDSVQVQQIRDFVTDPFNRELAAASRQVFPEGAFPASELTQLMNEIQKNIPGFQTPEMYTYISGLMYEMPVMYQDSVLIIALDMFLGADFEPYRAIGIPRYVARRMIPENMIPECARQIAYSWLPGDNSPKTLLDHMLLHGKVMYALDVLLPSTADSLKIGYTPGQLEWCRNNEASLWRLFIDQEMLYKGDAHILSRFMQDGPFTAGLPDGAPAMTGKFMGWQIIRAYMKKNPTISLDALFSTHDAQQILSRSGYKPPK